MFNNMLNLYLEHNRITELSIAANALQSLETFDLSNNKISKLDGNILKSLRRFKECIFTDNVFTEIERYIYKGDGLISLTLTLRNINVLANIFYFNDIYKLIVTCKERIDDGIDIFEYVPTNSKIKYLDLSKCFLTSIPHGISKLINLETFKVAFNRIIILENVFMGMTSLKWLDLSFNRITTMDKTIFNIYTLKKLNLLFNYIELLPSNINNMINRNLQINLCRNPLHSGIDVDLQNPELISIDQVNHDIIRNIRYDRIRIFRIPEDANFDLDVKKFYEKLNIPIDERLNFEKIKLCKTDKPAKHTKTRQEIEEMLQNIFNYITYKKEEKLAILIRRIEVYYYYEDNPELIHDSFIDYQKRNSIIDHFESIVITMTGMLTEKQEEVEEVLVRLLAHLNFNHNTTIDNVSCLDGQEEAFITTYLFLKQGNDCSSTDQKITEILANLKFEILKGITTGKGEKEEAEVFLNWRNILSEELGFGKMTNLYGNISIIPELHDKKYIVEQFFMKFTFQSITD
ncbi:Leucine rich repeat protein [Spraguea lophii 42_110]|uniref:Leucine rich repeat protein n=1 Tax=Spraguea lophii (strain 42_110) TaxID=1358809 RepID=S7W5T0_SPRLO|nr:Leucine rich repeat protein [Spraguea lophii 42_110]